MGKFYCNKTVVVTGGTGFVGTHFVQALLDAGARVVIPVHKRRPPVYSSDVVQVEADLEDLSQVTALLDGADYVFHAAGAVAAAGVRKTGLMEAIATNLVLGVRVLQGAWEAGVKRILLFSSSTGYPPADHPVKEEEFWQGPTYAGYFGYGEMRRYLERLCQFVHQKSPLDVAVVRPSAIYGPYDNFDPQTSHVIPALIRRAVEGEDPFVVWGDGKEVRDFLHVRDLVRGCLLMLEKKADCDPINIGYGKPVVLREALELILRAAGHNPGQLVFDTSKPAAIPLRMVDTAKAERELGFRPQISLEEGLKETVEWFRKTCERQEA